MLKNRTGRGVGALSSRASASKRVNGKALAVGIAVLALTGAGLLVVRRRRNNGITGSQKEA